MKSRIFGDEQLEKLKEQTPKESLQEYKTLGGQALTGVNWVYFKNLLNEVLGVGNWGYEPQMQYLRFEKTSSNHPSCSVPVVCYIYGKGSVVRSGEEIFYEPTDDIIWDCTHVGTAYYPTEMLQGDLIKVAITDGAKKCFSILGFCQDVYEGRTVLEEKPSTTKSGKPVKKSPRTGSTQIKTDEDKEKVKEAKKALKDYTSEVQKQLIEKQNAGEKLSDLGMKALAFNAKSFVALANEALKRAVAEGDKEVSFNVQDEQLKSATDLYTLHEWKLALVMTKKWFNFVLTKEGFPEKDA